MRRLWIGVALVAAAGLGAALTYAAIPGTDSTVQFCYKAADAAKDGGASVTVIDPAAGGKCKSTQASVSVLNQGLVTGDAVGPGTFGGTYPESTGFEAKVTTTKATKLFVVGSLETTIRCADTAPCGLSYIIFVDGDQVPLTGRSMSGRATATDQTANAFATASVGAGTHTVTWKYQSFGNIASSTSSTWVGAIAMGG